MPSLRFSPGWKLSLFTLLFLPLLLSLGFWQLRREAEKQALQEVYAARQAEAPRELEEVAGQGDLQYQALRLSGHYDNARVFLLDNRVHEGRQGFELIAPFETDSGTWVLVNRGWLPQGPYRSELPELPAVEGHLSLEGLIYVPLGEQVMLGAETPFSGWPRVIQSVDMARMRSELQLPDTASLFPYTLRLREGQPGVLERHWPVVSMSPETHRGYAVQWFTMAAVLLGLFIYAGLHPRQADNTQPE